MLICSREQTLTRLMMGIYHSAVRALLLMQAIDLILARPGALLSLSFSLPLALSVALALAVFGFSHTLTHKQTNKGLPPNGSAAMSGHVQVGDIVYCIDGESLQGRRYVFLINPLFLSCNSVCLYL